MSSGATAAVASWPVMRSAGTSSISEESRASQIDSLAGLTSPVVDASGSTRMVGVRSRAETSTDNAQRSVQSSALSIVNFPEYPAAISRPLTFLVLAEWEGSVLKVMRDHVVARTVPIRGVDAADEAVAEIPFDEIAITDHELVRPGALFRLTAGYEVSNGTRTRFSRVVFRRLPAWSKREIEQADRIAAQRFDAISVD